MSSSLLFAGTPYQGDRAVSGFQKPRGIFGEWPGATPKYAKNNGPLRDFRESMARMFIPMSAMESQRFVDSFSDPASRAMASLMAVDAQTGAGVKQNPGGGGYVDFLLGSVQHSFSEKVAVHEVLSDNYVAYFFGQSAPMFQYSGVVLNTVQDDQAANLARAYRDILRGTQLAKRRKTVTLRYDEHYVTGVLVNLTMSLSAADESYWPFSFSLLVKSMKIAPNPENGFTVVTEPAIADEATQAFIAGTTFTPTSDTRKVKKTVSAAAPAAASATSNAPLRVDPLEAPMLQVFDGGTKDIALNGFGGLNSRVGSSRVLEDVKKNVGYDDDLGR